MNNISINYNDMVFAKENSDYTKSSDFADIISDNEGSFIRECQSMLFNYNNMEILVGYDLCVTGIFSFDPGDWESPPYLACDIEDISVDITDVSIDGYEVDLSKEIVDILKKVIEKNL